MHHSQIHHQQNSNQIQAGEAADQKTVEQRLANFISIRHLQNKLPDELFQAVVNHINQHDDLPMRTGWDGQSHKCDYQQQMLISGHRNSSSVSFLLKNELKLATKIQNFSSNKRARQFMKNPVRQTLKKSYLQGFCRNPSSLAYISNFKNRSCLVKQFRNQFLKSKENQIKHQILNHDCNMYKRMKTVFGHAIIADGCGTPVYNCKFDLEDKFIISGADDGIIKIWSKDSMILQASLHGHQDVIIDIAVSKCNRYMASGSKDGTIILWNMHKCQIIKRLTSDHSSQVNKIQFIMVRCSTKQVHKNLAQQQTCKNETIQEMSYQPMLSNIASQQGSHHNYSNQIQYDQYLLTCSDDGSINIYDVSTFEKRSFDEYYTKGANNQDRIFTPHSKHISQKRQNEDPQNQFISNLKMAHSKLIHQINENVQDKAGDPGDQISRRTRKRQLPLSTNMTGEQSFTNKTTANSSSQSQSNTQDQDIFMVKVRPEDFRAGSRNKHIDSFSCNSRGYLAGGTNHGEVYLWKVNFQNIRRRKSEQLYHWIGSFKLHKKANHYVQFSPDGNFLMTGSADGTAALWDTNFVEKTRAGKGPSNTSTTEDQLIHDDHHSHPNFHQMSLKNIELSDERLVYRFKENIKEGDIHKYECQVDHIEWSVHGRYAFCALSVKQLKDEEDNNGDGAANRESNQKPTIVKIMVYDIFSKNIIENLDKACNLGKSILNYACVMKCHPFNDNILLACFDGGISILYDVQNQVILQEIIEYGIYSIDQFTMNNTVDVDFTSDGQYIAMSSIYGTISLYSTQEHTRSQYACTRVQQFFPYDNQMHDSNPYEKQEQQPKLCGFELNPYEVQPISPVVGLFKKETDTKITEELQQASNEELERQQIFAREFAIEEEKFYQDQLQDGLRQGYFNSSANNQNRVTHPPGPSAIDGISDSQANRLISQNQNSHLQIAGPHALMDDHEDSDAELLRQTRRGRTRQVRRLDRTDQQPEEIEISDDDEDFQENKSELSNLDDEDEAFDELASEVGSGYARIRSGNRQSFNYQQNYNSQRRQNYHQIGNQNHSNDMRGANRTSLAEEQKVNSQRNLRSQGRREEENKRSNSRYSLRQPHPIGGQPELPETQGIRRTRRRQRQIINSGQTSQFEEREDDVSNYGERQAGNRGMLRRTARLVSGRQRQSQNLLSSDDESLDDFDSSNDSIVRGRRGGRRMTNRINNRSSRNNENARQLPRTSGRNRNTVIDPENFNMDDDEFGEDKFSIESSQDDDIGVSNRRRGRTRQFIDDGDTQVNNGRTRSRQYRAGLANGRVSNNGSQHGRNNQRRNANRNGGGNLRRKSGSYPYDDEDSLLIDDPMLDEESDDRSDLMNEHEEVEEVDPKKALDDQKLEEFITEGPEISMIEFMRDGSFSQRGTKPKKGAVIIKEGFFQQAKDEKDEDYVLKSIEAPQLEGVEHPCYFCKRVMDQYQMVGPFFDSQSTECCQILESQEYSNPAAESSTQTGLYFHQKCLEVNRYVRYDVKKQKWLNLKLAIKHLVENKTYTCYRCLAKGATVQCMSCDRSFHGHYCHAFYMLATDYNNENWICIFCKNQSNYELYKNERKILSQFSQKHLNKIRQGLNKDHLLETNYDLRIIQRYQPQLNDEVMYMFQGHEKFYQSNNCFFYCGDQRVKSSTDLPWMKMPQMRHQLNGCLHCRVKHIYYRFASSKSSHLLKQYGDCSSDVTQTNQIITYVELEIIEDQGLNGQHPLIGRKFIAHWFPGECSQYMIPLQMFRFKLQLFEKFKNEGKLIGRRFKTIKDDKNQISRAESAQSSIFQGQQVKVVEESALEPDFQGESFWKSLVVVDINTQQLMRSDRGRRSRGEGVVGFDRSEARRISFWEILYPEELGQNIHPASELIPQAFDPIENQRLQEVLTQFIQKKTELCAEFLHRVEESIAYDYKCYVAAEMWLNLILERLRNNYYRSQDQMFYDLDLIPYCSQIYNGEEEELTCKAQNMIEKIRKELKQYINCNNENKSKVIKLVGGTKSGFTNMGLGFSNDTNEVIQSSNYQRSDHNDLFINRSVMNPASNEQIQPKKQSTKLSKNGKPKQSIVKIQDIIGAGGNSIKDHLQNMEEEKQQIQQSTTGDVDGNKIRIDFNQKEVDQSSHTYSLWQDSEQIKNCNNFISNKTTPGSIQPPKEDQVIKKRGRPRKNKVVDGVNTPTLTPPFELKNLNNQGSEVSESAFNFDKHDLQTNQKITYGQKQVADKPVQPVKKTRRQQKIEENQQQKFNKIHQVPVVAIDSVLPISKFDQNQSGQAVESMNDKLLQSSNQSKREGQAISSKFVVGKQSVNHVNVPLNGIDQLANQSIQIGQKRTLQQSNEELYDDSQEIISINGRNEETISVEGQGQAESSTNKIQITINQPNTNKKASTNRNKRLRTDL